MNVRGLYAPLFQVVGQIFRHPFSERRNQSSLPLCNSLVDLLHQIIDLPIATSHLNLRVEQSSRTNHLLGWLWAMLQLIFSWRRRNINRLIDALLKLAIRERPVV